ncbi:MAG: hypothetical protein AAFX39_12610 [Pseudomonadota bacterium]
MSTEQTVPDGRFAKFMAWLKQRRKLWTYCVVYAIGWLTMAGFFDLGAFGFDFDPEVSMSESLSGIAGIVGAYLVNRIPNDQPANDNGPPADDQAA